MSLLTLLIGLLAPAHAYAQASEIHSVIDSIGGALPGVGAFVPVSASSTAGGLNGIMITVAERVRPLLIVTSLLLIVVAGVRMVISQEDDSREKVKTLINQIVVGLILAYLIAPFINAFYGQTGEVPQGNVAGGAAVLNGTIYVVINWTLGLVAVLAVVILIVTGIRALFQSTSDEGITTLRRSIFAIAAGIFLIILREILALTMGLVPNAVAEPGQAEASPFLSGLVDIIDFVLAWVTFIAVAIVIYAGIRMILSMGNEEQMTKAKELIYRAIIGLIIIAVSFALVHFVVAAVL